MQRANERYERAVAKRDALLAKQQHIESVAAAVQDFEDFLTSLVSLHKDCSEEWKWQELAALTSRKEPPRQRTREQAARQALDSYKPSFWHRLFGSEKSHRAALEAKIPQAAALDEAAHAEAIRAFEAQKAEDQAIAELAKGILENDAEAHREVLTQFLPFREISGLGSQIAVELLLPGRAKATLTVNGDKVIPGDTYSMLQSGKLSKKKMPVGKFNELYQDYVCSCVLRVARELFALFPLDTVLVTAMGEILDSTTGHQVAQPLLSVLIPRATLDKLNMETIDCSDSMRNFKHNMGFKKTHGFKAVHELELPAADQ